MTRILIWLWIYTLLLATIGVSIHRVYCYCIGESSVSLFVAAQDQCQHRNAQQPDCCIKSKQPVKSCCEKSDDAKNCTEKTVKVIHLKSDLFIEFAGLETIDIDLEEATLPVFVSSTAPFALQSCAHSFPRPPPRSGRSIGIWNGVFRC